MKRRKERKSAVESKMAAGLQGFGGKFETGEEGEEEAVQLRQHRNRNLGHVNTQGGRGQEVSSGTVFILWELFCVVDVYFSILRKPFLPGIQRDLARI